jgi:hypothetical protein
MPDFKSGKGMQYQLVVKFPFEAIDDVQAREKAQAMLSDIHRQYNDPTEAKLQEVFVNKPPRGIALKN